jgi:hypothetical protein
MPAMLNRLASYAKQPSALRDFFCAFCLALLVVFFACEGVMAQAGVDVDKSADSLMVVLRETMGSDYKQDEKLQPVGPMRAKLSDGREVEVASAAFALLGDMHIRFVFDGPSAMPNAKPQDLVRLGMTPEQALQRAVSNIKRVYGNPVAAPFTAGLMQVQGKSPDYDSSYFLDRAFWRDLLRRHPEGILVGVPKRGGLVFTPMSNGEAVDNLRKGIGYLYSSSGSLRVSSALYLFRDDRWTVFQPPQPQ